MKPFAYARASDTADAVAQLEPGAKFLAGGTNLVDLMKLGVETPGKLVDVRRLGHDRIEDSDRGGLRIGAAVTNNALALDERVRTRYPVLSRALLAGASNQLRNLATVGGNLMQRTRCPYFQDVSKPCNKREPGSGCPAREGAHRDLAIIGHSEHCVAAHPGDMGVALAALSAHVHVTGPHGDRTIPIADFHRLPGDQPDRDTTLEPGELITAVELPPLPHNTRSDYRKARDRASFAFGLVTVAATLTLAEDATVAAASIALGAIAHKPWRATKAEEVLHHEPATEDWFRRAAEAELAAAQPLRDNAFKVPLATNLVTALLTDLASR